MLIVAKVCYRFRHQKQKRHGRKLNQWMVQRRAVNSLSKNMSNLMNKVFMIRSKDCYIEGKFYSVDHGVICLM